MNSLATILRGPWAWFLSTPLPWLEGSKLSGELGLLVWDTGSPS